MSVSAQIIKFPDRDQDIWERKEAHVIRTLSKDENAGEPGSPKFQRMVGLFTCSRVVQFKKWRDLEIRLLRDPENIVREEEFGIPVQVAAIKMFRQRLFA